MSATPTLATIFAAPSPAQFFDEVFGVRCRHVVGAVSSQWTNERAARWHARVDLGPVDAASVDALGVQHQHACAPDAIDERLSTQHTICADVSRDPGLAPLLDELATWVPSATEPPFAKLYASHEQAGFAMHMDAHHVFVLQLRGHKRWTVSDAVVTAPVCGGKLLAGQPVHVWPHEGDPIVGDDGVPLQAPNPAELRVVELAPGDGLYVPPGAWHATAARGESLAISMSPGRAPLLRVVMALLEQELVRRPAWRRDLVRGPTGAGLVAASIRRALDHAVSELRAVVREVDGVLLQRAWAMTAFARLQGAQLGARGEVRRSSVLVHADPRGFVLVVGDQACHMSFAGGEVELPLVAQRFLVALGAHPRVRADEVLSWDPALDWDGARELLQALVDLGVLAMADAGGRR